MAERSVLRVLVTCVLALSCLGTAFAWQPADSPGALLDQAQSTLVGNPGAGLDLARSAKQQEALVPQPRNAILLRATWLEAEALFRLGRLDEAAEVLRESLASFEQDSSEIYGKLLITSGRVARSRGDNGLALQSFQKAFTVFSGLDNRRYMAISLQTIGTLYANARQYERAIEYDERAVETYPDDPLIKIASLNIRGNALRRLDRYDEARQMFEEALELDIVQSSESLQLRLASNIAGLEAAAGDLEAAQSAVDRVKSISPDLTASRVPKMAATVAAKLLFNQGNEREAIALLDKAFAGTDFTATPEDVREAHSLAYEVYAAYGDTRSALAHLEAFKRLDDINRDVAASANLAILNAEFELSNKELEIATLRSERLEADVALIRAKRQQERLLAIGGTITAFCIIAFLVWQAIQSSRVQRITEALNKQLEGMNQKLRTSNAELEKANSAKTEFLATTSHEIRTPLNAVINLTEAVITDMPRNTDAHEKLSTALRSAEHLHEIVSDVLDVARFEGKRVKPHLSDISLTTIFEDVSNLWRPRAEEKGLKFEAVLKLQDSDKFYTDEKLLRQILSNLLSNAIKFTQEGEVHFMAEGGTKEEPLTIRVSDTGIGIEPKHQGVIFESFRQAEMGGTRSYSGTGLGLAICRQITKLLGGDIIVQSTPGQGTTFTVTLPLRGEGRVSNTPNESNQSATHRNVDEALTSLRVLAAEDNAVNAMVIKAILKGKVASLTIVENGAEAVEAVKTSEYDVILMDKQMPEMDGVEATRRIRALDGPASEIPIIAVTADAFAAARDELLNAGADDYLSKPIRPEDLKQAIAANCLSPEDPRAETFPTVA